MVGIRAAGADHVKLPHVVALICLMLAACSEGNDLVTEQPADTVRAAGLLLPWSQLTGRIVYATPSAIVLVDTHTRTVKSLYNVLADETPNDVAISPDGKRVAYSALLTSGATRLTIIDALTGTALSGNQNQSCPRWLKDGRFSYSLGNAVFLETARAGNLPQQPVSCQTWSQDGSWYAEAALGSTAQSDAIYRVDLGNTAPRELVTSNAA